MNILIGYAPWIIFWILSSNNTFPEAVYAATVSVIIVNLMRLKKGNLKILEMGSLLFFVVMSIIILTSDPTWLEHQLNLWSNATLAAIALFSLAVGRPFTIQYAKDTVEPELWETPGFKKVNQTITWVWTLSFLIQTVSSAVTLWHPAHETWFTWLIPTACFVGAIKFTAWYPDHYRAQFAPAQN